MKSLFKCFSVAVPVNTYWATGVTLALYTCLSMLVCDTIQTHAGICLILTAKRKILTECTFSPCVLISHHMSAEQKHNHDSFYPITCTFRQSKIDLVCSCARFSTWKLTLGVYSFLFIIQSHIGFKYFSTNFRTPNSNSGLKWSCEDKRTTCTIKQSFSLDCE